MPQAFATPLPGLDDAEIVALALQLPPEWNAGERRMFFAGFLDARVIAQRYVLADTYAAVIGATDGRWDSYCEAYDRGWSVGVRVRTAGAACFADGVTRHRRR